MNPWILPTTLFLVALAIWTIGFIFATKPLLAVTNLVSIVLAGVSILSFFQLQYPNLAVICLCVALLVAISNIGLTVSGRQANAAQGQFGCLVGQEGVCVTSLSPRGQVRVAEQVVLATTEGFMLPEGQRVKIIRSGAKIVVVEKIA